MRGPKSNGRYKGEYGNEWRKEEMGQGKREGMGEEKYQKTWGEVPPKHTSRETNTKRTKHNDNK